MTETVESRLEAVRGRIEKAAREVGRDPGSVRLIVVSKTFGEVDIKPVIGAGQRLFGENRVQEAQAKWPALRNAHPDLELHLIGPLQTNKVRDAVALFDVLHTLDRPKLAHALKAEMAARDKTLRLLVQVNTGEEPQKAGVLPADLPAFLKLAQDELKLEIEGLMCIPPVDEEPAVHFAFLAKLAREHGLPELSMGMSGDFEAAVELGATFVRVGSAIFGSRPPLTEKSQDPG
ncbi:MAG TPA: YggS family pyridoxal phosphate-dependent enzyme [Hyphomicrobiaceae bacterium]|nr:YggS family pyridoxal phosphate-dependent enzyme [Hyphomicrobiaceae bacterium]